MNKLYKYCKKCGALCKEFESGNVKCPYCYRKLDESEYEVSSKLRKPKRERYRPQGGHTMRVDE